MQDAQERIIRLSRECAQVQRAFAFHPCVSVAPFQNPPAEYQVSYVVKTLALDAQGECVWVDRIDMHVWMPPDFPASAPLFRPMTGIFHPNISPEGVGGLPPWDERQSLMQWITLVGFALAYRTFSAEDVTDETALAWAQANGALLPTDPEADFNPEAGGAPLVRIAAQGGETLTQLRRILDEQIAALRGDAPPTYDQLVSLSDSTRRQLDVFLPPDIPAGLRDIAASLDEAYARLPGALTRLGLIRRQRMAIRELNGARAVAAELAARVDVRCKVCDEAVALNLPMYVHASGAIKQVPPSALLQSWQEDLKAATESARQFADQLAAHEKNLQQPIEIGRSFGAILDRELAATTAELTTDIASATGAAGEALSTLMPATDRARTMLQALQRCLEWRAYVELLERGIAMERRMRGRDIATLQAYRVEVAGQAFGPFEMEQAVPLGNVTVTAVSLGRLSFEIVDAHTYRRLGASSTGKALVAIADPATGQAREYQFSISHRCDETRAQIDAVMRTTAEALKRLKESLATGESQIGKLAEALSSPAGFAQFEARQTEAEGRWQLLISDLLEIEQLKERFATYFLVLRYSEVLPGKIDELMQARKLVHEAAEGLSYIQNRMINQKGRLLLPEEFVAEHARLTRQREQAEPVALYLQKGIDIAAKLIRHRLADPKLWGAAVYPAPRVLAPPGPEMTQQILAASDEKLLGTIVALEEKMNVHLCPASWRSAPPPELTQHPPAEEEFEVEESPQDDDGLIIE